MVTIVLDIISDISDGIGTRITEYDIVDDTLNLKHENISPTKLWDYVGDCFMEKEVKAIFGKHNPDDGRYLIIVEKEKEGNYYSKAVLLPLLKQFSNLKYQIIDLN